MQKGGSVINNYILIGIAIAILFFCIGYLVASKVKKKSEQCYGTLHVETSDPDGPYLFLELETPVEAVIQRSTVNFKIDTDSYMSKKS